MKRNSEVGEWGKMFKVRVSFKCKECGVEVGQLLGDILGLLGSILLAFSVVKNPGGAYQQVNGEEKYLATLEPRRFWCGGGLLIVGFLLSMIGGILGSLS